MLEQAKILQKELFNQVYAAYLHATCDLDFIRLDDSYYQNIKSISIDYAIMEYVKNRTIIEADFRWNDLGNWSSFWEIGNKGAKKNHTKGDVIIENVNNSYIMSNNRLTVAVGVDNLIIINTADALLVADKSKAEEVKNRVNQLR